MNERWWTYNINTKSSLNIIKPWRFVFGNVQIIIIFGGLTLGDFKPANNQFNARHPAERAPGHICMLLKWNFNTHTSDARPQSQKVRPSMSRESGPPSADTIWALTGFYTITNGIAIQVIVRMINIVIAFFGMLANDLVIMVQYRNRRLRTHQATIFLLLAITDFSIKAF